MRYKLLRRAFSIPLALALWLSPGVGFPDLRAEEKRRIVILETMTMPFLQDTTSWLKDEMARLGLVEDRNVSFKVINADGDIVAANSKLRGAITELKPDLVVTIATLASRAGRSLLKESRIPQVFAIVADPVGEGYVSAIGKTSGQNITGRTHVVPAASKLAVVAQVLSSLADQEPFRIGVLRSTYPSAESDAEKLRTQVANHRRLTLQDMVFDFEPGEEGRTKMRAAAVELITAHKDQLDGLWLAVGPNELDTDYLRAVSATGLPIIYGGHLNSVRAGALLSLVSNAEINGRSTARIIKTILDGTPAGEIPVTRPNSFLVGLNLTTAKRLQAVIPSSILEMAGNNIFN